LRSAPIPLPAAERCPRLVAIATAVPPNIYLQADVRAFASRHFAGILDADPGLLQVFEHAHIDRRHLSVPLEWLGLGHGLAERNELYIQGAVDLAREAAQSALERAGIGPREIDHILFVSSTGFATPSVDARLANRLDFREDVRRTPIWGLGCAGGAAGISRALDLARGNPDARILVVAVELCSLTFQGTDLTRQNLVASALFSDGAAAAVIVGCDVRLTAPAATRPLVLRASHSTLWPDTLEVMGWHIVDTGLEVVFSPDIPNVVQERVCPGLSRFLEGLGLDLEGVDHLAMHPGGAKVLHAFTVALGRPPEAFVHSREVLREFGNMSSPTCLFVLDRFLRSGEIAAGDIGVLGALGPGFSAEFVLFSGGEQ
jgi:alkylresorcinol/alkylpyrone synthase